MKQPRIGGVDVFKRLVLAGTFAAASASAQATVLYDGSSIPGPPWFRFVPPPGASDSLGPAGVTLDTMPLDLLQAGYSRTDQILDSSPGFELSFTARLLSEAHASPHRAGFSVIVLDTLHRGVELGFWSGEVWAQNVGFTHGEGAAFVTSLATDYDLVFTGSSYALRAGGAPLLAGPLRDYGPALPYSLSNFIFFGDDTTSARGSFTLSSVTLRAVPEPGTSALFSAGLALLALRRRRTR